MSNKYSEWLLVSDIDGTLNDKMMNLPPANREAISSFVGNGGNFTLCSGRNLQSLTIHYNKLGIRTPAIFLNGAGIYDFSTEKLLSYTPISENGERVILDTLAEHKLLQLTVYTADKLHLLKRGCLYGLFVAKSDKLDYEIYKSVNDLPRGVWGKATFFGPRSILRKLNKQFSSGELGRMFACFFTSPVTLEIVQNGVNKGAAVERLASILNIDASHTAAIGDYYNDVEMLKRVAHPACCGQAPDDIKEICEYVACHCNNGAVADFIKYLEKKYIK